MEFNTKNNGLIKDIVDKVMDQKKYKNLSRDVVVTEVMEYIKKNSKLMNNKQTIKGIRAQLHKSYSSFQTKKKRKAEEYLEYLKQNINSKDIQNRLLSITVSTKERLPYYEELYQKIFQITGKPQTIIDLGCGLNPFSYPLMDLSSVNYLAYDVDNEDMKLLNDYFKLMKSEGLNGKAAILDVRNTKSISSIPPSDIILLLKTIDIIDKENHKPSEELIKQLIKKTKFIIVSFATKTLTRKPMKNPKRNNAK